MDYSFRLFVFTGLTLFLSCEFRFSGSSKVFSRLENMRQILQKKIVPGHFFLKHLHEFFWYFVCLYLS